MRNSTLLFSYVVPVKIEVEISQSFVAFSEYMNFKKLHDRELILEHEFEYNPQAIVLYFASSKSTLTDRRILTPIS